jgi:cytochrome P450
MSSQIVNNVFLSPLRTIPGPLIAKLTGKWLVLVDFAGNRTSTIHRLHEKYGTAVRVGPNEVSFSNISTVKEIYGQGTQFLKAPAYDNMSTPPYGIFALRDRTEHSKRRKLLSHAFSQASLNETIPTIHNLISKLGSRIRTDFGKPLNMLLLFRCLSLDIVGKKHHEKSFCSFANKI